MIPMSNWIEALILGAVQGLTEWLPISSEGVLTLIKTEVFGGDFQEAITFAIALHFGTLIAAAFYFRKELLHLIPLIPTWLFRRNEMEESDRKIADFLFIATLITGVVGTPLLLFSLQIDIPASLTTALIGILLIGTGLFQILASSLGVRDATDLKPVDGIVVGFAQGLASMPGLSRSGLTVTTLLLRGFKETEAIRLSFLMSIPVIFGAQILLQLVELRNDAIQVAWGEVLVGMVAAALIGWLTIAGLVRIARKLPFWAFAILLGMISLITALLI